MVTAATCGKEHHFDSPARLDLLQDQLFAFALAYGWRLQAWALFSNHYHFVAFAPADAGSLRSVLRKLHSTTAVAVNRLDGVVGRQVWYQYWDTRLTYERSYLARLRYVHENAVKHRLVARADAYKWCSAGWFEQQAPPAFYRTVAGFKIDAVNVADDYEPALRL